MKVMQINNVYNFGSTGKITYDIHNGLIKRNIESVVCYGRRNRTSEENIYKICTELYAKLQNVISRFTGIMYGGCYISTQHLIDLIKNEKPDVVHLQCLNGYFVNIYKLIEYLKKKGIPTVLTLHAEFMFTANCGHAFECEKWKTGCGKCVNFHKCTKSIFFDRTAKSWKKMKKAFDNFEKIDVISVSPWLMERAKQSPFLEDKNHSVILNGIDTDIFRVYPDSKKMLDEIGIREKKVIFHVTPYFSGNSEHIKGGYYVYEIAHRLQNEDIAIVVAGEYDCSLKYPDNMYMLGMIRDQKKLAMLYSMANVTLLTSKRETFSMVCVESLCCGTPVVGFRAGAPEMISLSEYSHFCDYGNVDELVGNLQNVLLKSKDVFLEKQAKNIYAKEKMIDQYVRLYKKCRSESFEKL